MWPNIENVTVINFVHFDQMYISPLLMSALKDDMGLISECSTTSINQNQRLIIEAIADSLRIN